MTAKSSTTYILYLSGKPGTGKYTIAKEISKSGFIICDNQLINNPIFELLNYDGFSTIPDFGWEAIAGIRDAVLNFIAKESDKNYVLTNNLYEDEGDRQLYKQVKETAYKRNSIFVPVRLLISQEEHLKRVTQLSRRERWKSIDPQDAYDTTPLLEIAHPNLLILNVSLLSATQAAEEILKHTLALKP